ncbi:DUF3307 domain-containing protein [Neptunicella sp. SCSIO 80796]|uniref:DUF3307 domain-containing protein n=1 Tax=Neptunicella plasticusilytica TaxID=3117012 RepID=UPI003A4D6579
MELLILLVLSHLLGDFYLQKESWIACRNQHHLTSPGLFKHCLVHLLLLSLVLFIATAPSFWQSVVTIIIIVGSHFAIDIWKSYQQPKLAYFVADQLLHLVVLLLVWLWIADISVEQLLIWQKKLLSLNVLIYAGAYILAAKPLSVMIAITLKQHTDGLNKSGQPDGLKQAGKWIGYVERWLVISFVLVGQFTGIGFLLAAKSVFRFGDLTQSKDRKLTEYMMLGTLFSVASALAIGFATKQLVA